MPPKRKTALSDDEGGGTKNRSGAKEKGNSDPANGGNGAPQPTLEVLQERLREVSQRSYKFAREIERLRVEAKAAEEESATRHKHLQDELIRKEQANKALTKHIQELSAMHLSDKDATKLLIETTLKRAEEVFLAKEAQFVRQQEELMKEIVDLRLFKQMRADLVAELDATKEAMKQTDIRHRQQVEELERRFNIAREKLEQEAAARIARVRQVYKDEVGKELDVESRFVRAENLRMAKELKFFEESSQQFQKSSTKLAEELAEVKLESSLQAQRYEILAKKQWKTQIQLQDAQNRIRQLEQALAATVRDTDVERAAWQKQRTNEIDELRKELSEAHAALRRKTEELRVVRKNAGVLIESRREVEIFFADALQMVRDEMTQQVVEEQEKEKRARMQWIRDLACGNGGQGGEETLYLPPLAPSRSLDVRDLTPEQRYKILRLMMARIKGIPTTASGPRRSSRENDREGIDAIDIDNAPPETPAIAMIPQKSSVQSREGTIANRVARMNGINNSTSYVSGRGREGVSREGRDSRPNAPRPETPQSAGPITHFPPRPTSEDLEWNGDDTTDGSAPPSKAPSAMGRSRRDGGIGEESSIETSRKGNAFFLTEEGGAEGHDDMPFERF